TTGSSGAARSARSGPAPRPRYVGGRWRKRSSDLSPASRAARRGHVDELLEQVANLGGHVPGLGQGRAGGARAVLDVGLDTVEGAGVEDQLLEGADLLGAEVGCAEPPLDPSRRRVVGPGQGP